MEIIKNFRVILGLALIAMQAGVANAQSGEESAELEYTASQAVAKASKAWRDAFNRGDAAAAAALYEENAVMVAKPFGTFTGRAQIQTFWENLVKQGFDNVIYMNTTTKYLDPNTVQISASWRMNKASGVITNELWVLQPDGQALLREDHFEVVN